MLPQNPAEACAGAGHRPNKESPMRRPNTGLIYAARLVGWNRYYQGEEPPSVPARSPSSAAPRQSSALASFVPMVTAIEIDLATAAIWYEKAAEKVTTRLNWRWDCCISRAGCDRDGENRRARLGKAAIRAAPRRQYNLALLTLEGDGTQRSEFAAETLCARQRTRLSRRWSPRPFVRDRSSRGAEHDRDGEM